MGSLLQVVLCLDRWLAQNSSSKRGRFMALPERNCSLSKRVVILSLALYHFRLGTTQVRSVRMLTNDAWILQPCCFIGDWCFRSLLTDIETIYRRLWPYARTCVFRSVSLIIVKSSLPIYTPITTLISFCPSYFEKKKRQCLNPVTLVACRLTTSRLASPMPSNAMPAATSLNTNPSRNVC